MIAHHRQIRAARHAHAHDRGDLRNAHRAHHRVVSKNAAEIIGIRKNILLEWQKHSRGIHQINRWDSVLDGDVLRADHFLGGHREERAGFHGGIIGDQHERAPAHFREAGNGSGARRATPVLVHFIRGINSEFEKL